jgi:hypothetical protein
LLHLNYLPLAVFATAVFLAINLLLFPLAYLAALAKKFQLCARGNSTQAIQETVVFIVVGWLTLPIAILVDTVHFFRHLFSDKVQKIKATF